MCSLGGDDYGVNGDCLVERCHAVLGLVLEQPWAGENTLLPASSRAEPLRNPATMFAPVLSCELANHQQHHIKFSSPRRRSSSSSGTGWNGSLVQPPPREGLGLFLA
ncbi:hypothetical protein PCANC_11280 [Puccinia coronata f. sp. avenae]|uniref:Uncharacterized protein n=1 Tax=Puccinia coronata f. sp. avenae TaxID=200324 RepID=A0A2N5V5D7_9BASI|nr:hypothetical protein PCANC_11280 [Puccinia coronata f. sp. avenae]